MQSFAAPPSDRSAIDSPWGGLLPRPGQPCLHKASSTQHDLMEPVYGAPGDAEAPGQGDLMRFLSEPSRGRLTSLHSSNSNAANVQVRLCMIQSCNSFAGHTQPQG